MDRRGFLRSAVYFTVVSAGMVVPTSAGAQEMTPPGTYAFPAGLASGDPKEGSIVFWTRCAPAAGNAPVNVRLEVANDPAFASLAAVAELTALPAYDFTVRVKVVNLSPDTRYFYRFVAGQDVSVTGQTKTAPAVNSSPAQVRFAWMTCQDWEANHWAAMELLAGEELDFIVHLGDYVYETVSATFQPSIAEPAHARIVLPSGMAVSDVTVAADSLDDYRTLYKTYRSDLRLQEVHRKFPMIVIWDDHEYSDDSWQDHQTYTNENKQQTARRRNANQAWAEYMPVDWGDVSFDLNNAAYDNIRIYRDFKFGNLMHLIMTDERLYRDDHVVSEAALAQLLQHDPVNGNDAIGARFFVPQSLLKQSEAGKTAALQRSPSMLGPIQAQWWKDTLKASNAIWKVWGNEVTLNRMWVDLRSVLFPPFNQRYVANADSWDGYPSDRGQLMSYLREQNISNVVAVTGDLHAFQCGVLYDGADEATGTPVAVDFVSAGISSSSFYQYVKQRLAGTPLALLTASSQLFDRFMRENNPALAYADHDAQGYAAATVTPAGFSVIFNKVKPLNADGTRPQPPLAKRTRITLQAGLTTPSIEDNLA